MKITDVRVRKLVEDERPMKAVVSVTFDDCLTVHDIKVIEVKDRTFVVMPSVKTADGTYKDVAHPTNAKCRAAITEAVLDAYTVAKVLENSEEFQ